MRGFVAEMRNHSDNCAIPNTSLVVDADAFTQGILIREEVFCQGLIDNDHALIVRRILGIKVPALKDRNLHRSKEV